MAKSKPRDTFWIYQSSSLEGALAQFRDQYPNRRIDGIVHEFLTCPGGCRPGGEHYYRFLFVDVEVV